MILIVFFTTICFIPLCLSNCPNNKTYGYNCNLYCTNCSSGCDVSGTCFDGVCSIGFYGRGCQESNIGIAKAPALKASNCSINVITPLYMSTTSVNPINYYVVYGPSKKDFNQKDYSKWPSKTKMTCDYAECEVNVTILPDTYMFGVYFDFEDLRYSDPIQSLVSETNFGTCDNTSIPKIKDTTLSTKKTTNSTTISTTGSSKAISVSKFVTTTKVSSTALTTLSIITTLTITSSIIIYPTVHNLVLANKSSEHIYVTWLQYPSPSPVTYKIIVKENSTVVQSLETNSLFQNVTNLVPGSKYTISLSLSQESSSAFNNSMIVCTAPLSYIKVDKVEVQKVERKSMDIAFPVDRTNYTCSINIYRVAIIEVKSIIRKKRDVSSNTAIPKGASLKWNSTKIPLALTLDNLNSATKYRIYAEIYTNVNGTEIYYSSTSDLQTKGPTDGAIVAIVLGILLFFLLIIILIVLLCLYKKRKQRLHRHQYCEDIANPLKKVVDDNKPQSFAYWSVINDKMEPRYLVLNPNEWTDDFEKMETMAMSNQNYSPDGLRFIDEYNSLPDDSPYSYIDSQTHHAKNKRPDIFPYDHNRVKLRRTSAIGQSDYINASFIDGYLRKKAYISSQSPFDEETTNDFWKMIYEQNVGQIIMLTEVENNNVTKSTLYWPQLHSKYVPKEIMYGTISVKIINEINFAFYDIREFEIKDVCCTVEAQLVTQYHFHGWPHNDIPENGIAFLDFYQTVKTEADISNGPLLIHCGTGISQSAVFIAFDILNQQVIHENCINVFRTVAQLRRSRSNMLHTSKQYMFLYDILFESLLCGQFIVNTNVKKIYKLLHKVNPQSRIEYIREQFYLLQTYHAITTHQCPDPNDICFMDSIDCYQNLASIASPIISADKIDEFWNTVFKNKIEVIIDLKTTDDKPYYIRDNLQSFDLSINEIGKISECFRKFDISLYDLRHEKRQNLIIYQFGTVWVSDENTTSEPSHNECVVMVELIHHLIMNHSRDRIMAHCNNGWSKSGLFLTCFNVALKMYRSKYVMVYNVVKSLKFYRYEFVSSFAQYRFIYNLLKKWVDLKMPNESRDDDFLPGQLPSGDKLKESLFTHEQTPVLRPEQMKRFSQPLSRGSSYHSNADSDLQDKLVVVHYKVGAFPEIVI